MSAQKSPHSNPYPRPGVSAAVFRDGEVLLGQRAKPPLQGLWSLPGGHIEPGETALGAAHRELLEETGVRAELKDVAGVADVILRNGDGSLRAHYVLSVFYGIWLSGEAIPGSDCQGVRWADPLALDGLRMTEGTPAVIAKAFRLLQG